MEYRRKLLLLSFTVLLVSQPVASEASEICDELRVRLASAPQVVGNTAEIRRYSSAITRQNFEIRKTRQDLQRLGCGSPSVIEYGSSSRKDCTELSAALSRMEENKRDLVDMRDALRYGGTEQNAVRGQILAAIDANGCNDLPVEDVNAGETDRPRTPYLDTIDTPPGTVRDFSIYGQAGLPLSTDGLGNLRTLCVRTCDGAFFPISSNATPLSFRRDAQLCQQMCPGIETELYYHSIRNEESADMVSAATGKPYRSLPTAFAYLNRRSGEKPSCRCNLAEYYSKMRDRANGSTMVPDYDSSVVEIKGPQAGSTADTKPPASPMERPYEPSDRNLRQVGPVFLPSETSSIDLRHPATPGPQPLQQ